MKTSQRSLCFIVVVLGFTFFPALPESKGATASHFMISYGPDLQKVPN